MMRGLGGVETPSLLDHRTEKSTRKLVHFFVLKFELTEGAFARFFVFFRDPAHRDPDAMMDEQLRSLES
jgi:hypothetical protein